SFTFTGDLGTGIWSSAAGAVNITADGVNRVTISAFGIAMNGALDMGNSVIQSVADPSNDNNVGDRGYNDNRYASTGTNFSAGDGLSGGGTLAANRSFAVDNTVIRTAGGQTIGGDLSVTGAFDAASVASLGTMAAVNLPAVGSGDVMIIGASNIFSDSNVNITALARTATTMTAGDGLSGGGTLAANRSFAVDTTVVRTTGNQSIAGNKTFTGTTTSFLAIEPTTIAATGDIASTTLSPG
ncbi:unnamed protein product, partial [marine sediment metagenome]